jgi:hypothetical protein
MQDLRVLVDWGLTNFWKREFRQGTEIQRHPPYGAVEKNWFVFWDKHGQIYVHHDLAPKRGRHFAKLAPDGSIGKDLAKQATTDKKCMAKLMPKLAPRMESVHQATNSLSITTCRRSDPACEPDDSNTFILNIFHFKSFHYFHGVYEPYVMLFQQASPFAIHAIGQKPLWISGRGGHGEGKRPVFYSDDWGEWNQTEMIYVTSVSWKAQGMKYHGFIDDVMFIGFGIEDERSGGIDVVAGDLLADLGLCSKI